MSHEPWGNFYLSSVLLWLIKRLSLRMWQLWHRCNVYELYMNAMRPHGKDFIATRAEFATEEKWKWYNNRRSKKFDYCTESLMAVYKNLNQKFGDRLYSNLPQQSHTGSFLLSRKMVGMQMRWCRDTSGPIQWHTRENFFRVNSAQVKSTRGPWLPKANKFAGMPNVDIWKYVSLNF